MFTSTELIDFPGRPTIFFTDADSLDFGAVSPGDSSVQNIWLINKKDTSITINEFYLKDSLFTVLDSLPLIIPQNDSVQITIMYKPYADGYFTDKLNISNSTADFLIGRQIKLSGQTTLVSVNDNGKQIYDFYLSQNFPNPFNPSTSIECSIPKDERVSLKIYNPLGEEIVNKEFTAGKHIIKYNEAKLSTGIYYYRITAGSFTQTKKLVLIK